MITFFHFTRLAVHNIRRGGQRILIALLCITFGTMSLVAMTMLAKSIESALVKDSSEVVGGDISMGRKFEETISSSDINQLEGLVRQDKISRFTLIAFSSSITFRKPDSGELHFAGNGLGIDPENYPLAGTLAISEPGSIGLPSLLQQVGDVIVTRDVAEQFSLHVGDPILLSDLRFGVSVEGTVRGIAYDTPNHQGDKIYYSTATAQELSNGLPVVNTAIVNATNPGSVSMLLDESGWSVDWTSSHNSDRAANLWLIGLRGAGILGLLVGGIGIANTMQVLLRRRQNEIAIMKTLGYREGDLCLIFMVEAGLLGLAGSLPGAVLGVVFSTGLLEIFRKTSTMLYQWTFSPVPPAIGILVGVLSTVILSSWSILLASRARPMALLRNEPVDWQRIPIGQGIGLALLLGIPYVLLASLVMESIRSGVIVLGIILLGIGILGGFFSGLLWLTTHLITFNRFNLTKMAIRNLRRRNTGLIFAMIALFTGVLAMSLGLAVIEISKGKISGNTVDFKEYNLAILSNANQESQIVRAVQAYNPETVAAGYRSPIAGMRIDREDADLNEMDHFLVGRTDPVDYTLHGAEWGSQPDGVYTYVWSNVPEGSQIDVTFTDGTVKTFTVVGSYDVNYDSSYLYPSRGLLIPAEGFLQNAKPEFFTYFVQISPKQLNETTEALGKTLHQSTVINLAVYASRFIQSYRNIYMLPIVLAGLALVAGLLLIANSVSLAMADRQYEIGVLKTIGYSKHQILKVLMVEFGLGGVLATCAAILSIQGFLMLLAIGNRLQGSDLLLGIPSVVAASMTSIGLTLFTVYAISKKPAEEAPMIVLNEHR